jgi:hypothetical protein
MAATLRREGSHFPIAVFKWDELHTYSGEEINHLWFTGIVGREGYGNLVVTWRGPMEVRLENVRDQTERIEWEKGARISGPDLFHVVAEFPQIGGDLSLMYALQAMLADELAGAVSPLAKGVAVRGTDVFVGNSKLNVGVCAAFPASCAMHFGVNMGLAGEPSIPQGVDACCLSDLLAGDEAKAVDLMVGVVSRWTSRIDEIYLKAYKTA